MSNMKRLLNKTKKYKELHKKYIEDAGLIKTELDIIKKEMLLEFNNKFIGLQIKEIIIVVFDIKLHDDRIVFFCKNSKITSDLNCFVINYYFKDTNITVQNRQYEHSQVEFGFNDLSKLHKIFLAC